MVGFGFFVYEGVGILQPFGVFSAFMKIQKHQITQLYQLSSCKPYS